MNFYDLLLDDEQEQFVKAILSKKYTIVFCNARAGTGKTTLAMGAANLLYQDKRNGYDGIVYIVSPYGEQRQGYLPGSQTEKSEVYFEPAYQAMQEVGLNRYTDVTTESMAAKKKGDGFIKMMTHTYMRGDNLKKKIIIIDEAQNFTIPELKKVLTRIHDNSIAIVIGHTGQIDVSGKSGFQPYIEHFKSFIKGTTCELTINHRGELSAFADALEE